MTICICRKESPKEPDRKSLKLSPDTSKKTQNKTPAKTPKSAASKKKAATIVKTEAPIVKSESPENKPVNGQSKEGVEEPKKDEGKTIKIQSAGAGQAGADYNPSKKKYHPINDAFWNRGEK